jgi:putative ABC transport system permease protein
MLLNYIKLAIKHMSRHRMVSAVNLLGLSLGFAVCVLIALFVRHQWSFDRLHGNYDRLARLNTTMKYPGASETTSAYSSFPMGPFLQETFGKEVEAYCRLTFIDRDFIVQHGPTKVTVGQVFAADSSFFKLFDFKLYQGDPVSALSAPQGIVLTKKIARQVFGTPDALGKTLSKTYVSAYTQHDTTEYFTVSGILEDLPATSHLQFDALVSGAQKPYWKLWNPDIDKDWHVLGALTYILFRSPQTNLAEINRQIPEFLKNRMPGSQNVAHQLQAMADIHLGSKGITDDRYSNFEPFDGEHIRVFGIIGLFVLLIAGINYSNLAVILAGKRSREVAVRRAVGANRTAVVIQFLSESALTSVLAVATGAALIWLSLPFLPLLDYPVAALAALRDAGLVAGALLAVVAFGIVAGSYPALVVGRTQPARVLRGESAALRPRRGAIVPVLVTGQFIAAIALMIGTLVCFRQMQFMQNRDLGYSTHQVLALDLGLPNLFKSAVLKEKISAVPGVESVALSDQIMGNGLRRQGVRYVHQGKEEHVSIPCLSADEALVDLYGMELAAGRMFSKQAAENGTEYLINEHLARQIGWDSSNAIGQQIRIAWMPAYGTVVGVLKDFHFNSLHHRIEPLCLRAGNLNSGIGIRVATGSDLPTTMRRLEEAWKSVITDRPFDYEWLDDQFAQTYAAETRLSRLTAAGAGLAVFIACLGLFALAMFNAESRTKEIGIRKVLGAGVASVTGLLTREFIVLVLIALLVASPLAYFLMNRWLEDFAYRIEIEAWMFAAAGALAVAVAFLTVGFQSVRAALANPVRSLRNE